MSKKVVLLVLLIAGIVKASSSRTPRLEGAVHKIPVYGPAKMLDRSEFAVADDLAQAPSFSGLAWDLATRATPMRLKHYYEHRLPSALVDEDERSNKIKITWVPLDAADGERVEITIDADHSDGFTRFHIAEVVPVQKRQKI
jgi:hypothetical protein